MRILVCALVSLLWSVEKARAAEPDFVAAKAACERLRNDPKVGYTSCRYYLDFAEAEYPKLKDARKRLEEARAAGEQTRDLADEVYNHSSAWRGFCDNLSAYPTVWHLIWTHHSYL